MVLINSKERNHECTVYVGNLEAPVTEALLWELMIQFGNLGKCDAGFVQLAAWTTILRYLTADFFLY